MKKVAVSLPRKLLAIHEYSEESAGVKDSNTSLLVVMFPWVSSETLSVRISPSFNQTILAAGSAVATQVAINSSPEGTRRVLDGYNIKLGGTARGRKELRTYNLYFPRAKCIIRNISKNRYLSG